MEGIDDVMNVFTEFRESLGLISPTSAICMR